MKTPLIAAALLLSSMAGAQTTTTGDLTFRLDGCSASGKSVLCSITYFLNKLDQAETRFTNTKIFTEDGNQIVPDWVSLGGEHVGPLDQETRSFRTTAYKGIPIKLTFDTQQPVSTTSIRAIILNFVVNDSTTTTIRFDNISVHNTSARVPTQTKIATPVNLFNVQLSNCKNTTKGSYTCTSATVTPVK